jgi:hypothetical protein
VIENQSSLTKSDLLADEFTTAGFMFDRDSATDAIRRKQMFQLFDPVESLKLDLYPRELIEGELTRSNKMPVFEGIDLPVVSRQDAAASKLIWISKGSHKSRRDLRQLFIRCSQPERDFISSFASSNSLSKLLEQVLQESDEAHDK